MIKLLILFTLILNVYSFDGVAEVANSQVQEEKHNQLLGTAIEDDITSTTTEESKNYKTNIEKKEKEKVSSKEPEHRSILQNAYFIDFFTFSDSSLYCPPLNPGVVT
jgi:hypothetical protein